MKPIEWVSGKVRLLDQTKLPWEEIYLELCDYQEVAQAIKEMQIRGAPAIGVTAAYGLALGAQGIEAKSKDEFLEELASITQALAATRPTARNLFWALERMGRVAQAGDDVAGIKDALLTEAQRIDRENEEGDRFIAELGAELIGVGSTILTHCNTGSLATAGYGTALGVIKKAHEQGKKIAVYATETRPLLQGARLTAWELVKAGIPATLISDGMAGHFLRKKAIDCVIVGADRIAANGDVANKIGTYMLAVLARENDVPFYVAAPTSTIDLFTASGDAISIEERSRDEVTHVRGVRITPDGIGVANPSFDVTPHRYIAAIITEKGVVREPYTDGLREVSG